jgi:hypothetical protein
VHLTYKLDRIESDRQGLEGNDILKGEAGNDTLYGGIGDDTLGGGLGTDIANFLESLAGITASLVKNTFLRIFSPHLQESVLKGKPDGTQGVVGAYDFSWVARGHRYGESLPREFVEHLTETLCYAA